MKNNRLFLAVIVFSFVVLSCHKEVLVENKDVIEINIEDWKRESHEVLDAPNYDVVFNQEKVNRIDIVLSEKEWKDMQEDLSDVLSSEGGGGPGRFSFSDEKPAYFPCDFYFNGIQWYNVGIRYKGNSSLHFSQTQGLRKLPFRLDFDEFENDYPQINDQRFYGFKELSLGNNFKDQSLMREKSATDLFRSFGVPAVRTAFYEVYVDSGNGAEYFGLYTMNEIVFDTFLSDFFGSKSGNCYKPDGDGARLSNQGFSLQDFELKTNKKNAEKSDILIWYNILHHSSRSTDVEQWKLDLESVFDVDGFLKYLAVNNTIQNWDTYGNMTHNYYLYHDPYDGLIKWIVWDNNEAFNSGGGRSGALSLEMSEVGANWPLINYIIGDQGYFDTYKAYVQSFIKSLFREDRMIEIYNKQQSLLALSASNEKSGSTFLNGINSFYSAVETLKSHCVSRINSAEAFVE